MSDQQPAAGESPAQKQARLRRERRAAKLQAGGEDRLKAITALQGGTHRDVKQDVPVKPAPEVSGDPDVMDISEHHYTPATQPRLTPPFAFEGRPGPQATPAGIPNDAQDMMTLMQQLMSGQAGGGMPGGPGQGGQPNDLPPGLANLFSAMQGGPAPDPSPEQSSAWLWRLVHSLFSLGLAIYIVFLTPFTGSKQARTLQVNTVDWAAVDAPPSETFAHFFYLFATFQVVLQTSRYYVERGQLQGSGMLSSMAQLLPEPYAGYVRVVGRYSVIYSTVVSDAMIILFGLGVSSWWRGAVA